MNDASPTHSTFPDSTVPKRKRGYHISKAPRHLLLQDANNENVLALNETSALIWHLCAGDMNVGKMLSILCESFPDSRHEIVNDVYRTLDAFKSYGLLTITDPESPMTKALKNIAILVIAATNQPVYVHYIHTFWTEFIRYTNAEKPNIDVFLLFENATSIKDFKHLEGNIIQDPTADFSSLCKPEFQSLGTPGILSKTVHAFELLQDRYDVFFRTNLSSMIRASVFDRFVQNKDPILYSGALVWTNALRQQLLHCDRIGRDKSVKSLSELADYEGNTFISGSGYFLNSAEVKGLVQRKDRIRYDIVDDVSVGLLFAKHEALKNFSLTVSPTGSAQDVANRIEQSTTGHIRLEHFHLNQAQAVWEILGCKQIWK